MRTNYDFADKYRDQLLRCSSCGFCRAVCPVFGISKRPAYNAREKMLILGEVMAGNIDLDDELIETLFQCTMCRNCTENCPSGVNPPEIIKQARKDMVNIGSCHPVFKGMNNVLMSNTNIYTVEDTENFDRKKKETVVTGCPYCARTFNNKTPYERLGENGVRVIHISQFL